MRINKSKFWVSLIALSLTILGTLLYALQLICSKLLFGSKKLGIIEQFLIKSISYFICSNIGIIIYRQTIFIKNFNFWMLLLIRSLFGIFDNLSQFLAISAISVTLGTIIYNVYPVLTLFCAVFFLGEKFKYADLFLMIIAFVGVIIMIEDSIKSRIEYENVSIIYFLSPIFGALISAF